jgi:hypothetical protein
MFRDVKVRDAIFRAGMFRVGMLRDVICRDVMLMLPGDAVIDSFVRSQVVFTSAPDCVHVSVLILHI